MSDQPESRSTSDDAMARQSGAVSEDRQPVATDEDTETTAQGLPEGTAGSGQSANADISEIK
jgi:hypothetical protein